VTGAQACKAAALVFTPSLVFLVARAGIKGVSGYE
jgi:hypothetical protein